MPLAVRVIAYLSVAVLLLTLALTLFRWPRGGGTASRARSEDRGSSGTNAKPGSNLRHCPLCGSALQPGEKVSSRVFTPKGDRIMHIFGCPRCWPSNIAHVRVCPVCEKEVPREGFVVARLFERPTGHHVHVLGCSGCREINT